MLELALHTLKPLPYAADALAPHLSSKTIELHRAAEADLVAQLNTAIAGTEFEHAALPELHDLCDKELTYTRVHSIAGEHLEGVFAANGKRVAEARALA